MQVFALWFGGPNYISPDMCDAEEFPSIKAAELELQRREQGGDPSYPCVSESEMWLYAVNPNSQDDPYPNWTVTLGPRGGIVRSIA